MYRLTEKRLHNAKAILDKYRAQLFAHRGFNAPTFERELRDLWKVGYLEMKSIARDMLKNDDYREVAVWYMEDGAVPSEFKPLLASVYGVKSYNHAKDLEEKRKEYWAGVFRRNTRR